MFCHITVKEETLLITLYFTVGFHLLIRMLIPQMLDVRLFGVDSVYDKIENYI